MELIPDHLPQQLGFLQTIPMADKDGLGLRGDGGLLHVLEQGLKGGAPAPDLFHKDQPAFIIHMKDRLDIQHGTQYGGGGGYPAATMEMVQIVYREPVAKVQFVFFHIIPHLLDGLTCPLLLHRKVDEHALPQGRT